jgi:hypothetical protein
MRDENEMELVELVERELEADPNLDRPNIWESQIAQVLAEAREAKEVADAASDFRPSVHALTSPGRIAEEVLERSRYLRSRPLKNMKRAELAMLVELDSIEAQARALELQRQLGTLSEIQVATETATLGMEVYGVRGRYADLLRMQGEPFPSRTKPLDPEARKRELAEIDAFLARKKARQS